MAQSFVTDAGTLVIPQAVASITVATANSGLATNGVVMLVGEADAGPRFSLESVLQDNAFGPDQLASVIAKYQSGPLVDAFNAVAQPSNDPNITGAPNRVILVKTNDSAKASKALTLYGGGAYSTLADKSYGKLGNLIYFTITPSVTEVVPTTSAFTWLLPIGAVDVGVRINGGALSTVSMSALTTPAAAQTALDAVSGITVTGGASRGLLSDVAGNLSLTVTSGNKVQIDYTSTWDGTTPSAGDTLYIPTNSVLSPGADQNAGSYVVESATTNQIVATKLMDASGTPGTLTAPVNVSSTAVAATTDVQAWAPLTISNDAGNPGTGYGKALELAELTSAADRLSNLAYTLNTTRVSWVSKSGAPKLIVSGAEYRALLNVNRQRDNVQEDLEAGGEVALKIGYTGTTAVITISDSVLTATVVGGAGTSLSMDLKDFPTISDVATFINSKAGFKAAVGTAILGQLPSTALDDVTSIGVATQFGEYPGRFKIDGYRFFNKVSESVLVRLQDSSGNVVAPVAGLPQPVTSVTYLEGGTKGSTSDSDVVAALAALEKVRGNILVPLFSRDASSDITDKLTESGSSYTIAGVQANTRTHVLKMSTLKRKKNRQAILSVKDTFSNAKTMASNTAQFRCAMAFQDARNPGADGTIRQYQPWMNAAIAAGMQTAGFYKAIVHKFANIVGALQAAKDFDDQDDTQVEDALLAGLLPLRRAETGGWYWVSDQTTYGKDSNFVFNSIQAVYVADLIALTTAQRMENAFVGQSLADVNAALAMATLETIMEDFLRLKLIARSDDAPKGFKSASIKISGTSMVVSVEIKLAGALYFIPISFLVSQVTQSA